LLWQGGGGGLFSREVVSFKLERGELEHRGSKGSWHLWRS
jgi:hypothetical protein